MHKRIALGIVAASLAAAGNAAAENVLSGLTAYGDRMEKVAEAVLSGGDTAKAGGDWKVTVSEDVKKELTAAGAAKVRLAGYEFQMVLGTEKDHDRIDLIVHATSRSSGILAIKTTTDRWGESAKPYDKLTGAQKPFADAAKAILAAAKAKGSCVKLPSVDDKLMAEIAPGPIGEEARRKVGKLDETKCGAFERAKSPVRVNVDDGLILVMDKSGKAIGGLRFDLDLDDKGGVKYSLKRYKSLDGAKKTGGSDAKPPSP
jgi:hypothetical protein